MAFYDDTTNLDVDCSSAPSKCLLFQLEESDTNLHIPTHVTGTSIDGNVMVDYLEPQLMIHYMILAFL